jgi:hypothetical protein
MSEKSSLRFSIIIPLEFHRGQVEACLKGWVFEQTYPREQYEIVAVGCPSSLDEKTISYFKNLLSERDRLILFDEPHDMALCAYAAEQAKGEILFFTESHCLPEPNILSVAEQALRTHSHWAGFSGQSIRITPNRLSIVEADMYEADIQYGMKEHSWRKILDQCFIVRAENYHQAGGFRPELGHFAEWHLAAHMHQKGYQIGYVPEAQVHHYYVGDIEELIEFTTDFARGEMKYHAEFLEDETHAYFSEPLEWCTHQWQTGLLPMVRNLAYHTHSKNALRQFDPREIFIRAKFYLELFFFNNKFKNISFRYAHFRFHYQRLLLISLLYLQFGKPFLGRTFVQLILTTLHLERLRFIQNLQAQQSPPPSKFVSSFIWTSDDLPVYPFWGLYASEEWQGKKFRWSAPVAMIKIPLTSGHYQLKIEWLSVKNTNNLILYINGKPFSGFREDTTLTISFHIDSNSPTNFALTCEPLITLIDKRILGLPITSISITPMPNTL